MNRKSISIALAYVTLGSVLGSASYLYFELNNDYTKLQLGYESLLADYNVLQSSYDELESDYQSLNSTHHILVGNYTQLDQAHLLLTYEYNELSASYQILADNHTALELGYGELVGNYTTLEQNYTDLSNEHAILQDQYQTLFNDYDSLSEAFNEPLSDEATPSTAELEQWLTTDDTDEIHYNEPDFLCGDFAVMLSLHAKMKDWDMGIVGVIGHTESYEAFDHAFNAIICDEGLAYVEPQSDEVWWYEGHVEIVDGEWHDFPDFGDVYVKEYITVVWYN